MPDARSGSAWSDPALLPLEPVGHLRTCFPEKFGIPRQSGLAPLARGVLRFSDHQPAEIWRQALKGLEDISHVWVTFVFHAAIEDGWKSLVRPPRLGGREKMGVFATRSPHRPNFLGQSLLAVERVDFSEPSVTFSGVDLLDGTPVVDLRPYHPGHDLPQAAVRSGWIDRVGEPVVEVTWAEPAREALAQAAACAPEGMPIYEAGELRDLVHSLVALDPRPGHLRGGTGEWAMRLLGFDVRFAIRGNQARIETIDLDGPAIKNV